MARFALIVSGEFVRLQQFKSRPGDIQHKSVKWLPCEAGQRPSFDGLTEVLEGPTYSIGEDSVTESWTKRDKTADELDADKVAAINTANGGWSPILKMFLNHENRIRALESKGSITMAQFKTGAKALL